MRKAVEDAVRPKITSLEEAERLVQAALDALDALEPIVAEETQQLRTGRIREGLALGAPKSDAARAYLDLIAVLQSNAIALGRFQPASIELLRRRHQSFSQTLALNSAVLRTARTVSESILREVSAEVAGSLNPQGYSPQGRATSSYTRRSAPLSVSRTF